MPTTYYHTVNGRIRGESTAGVRTDYLTDALGSVVATVNSSAQVVNTYRYKPHGEQLAKTGAGVDPRFQWSGARQVSASPSLGTLVLFPPVGVFLTRLSVPASQSAIGSRSSGGFGAGFLAGDPPICGTAAAPFANMNPEIMTGICQTISFPNCDRPKFPTVWNSPPGSLTVEAGVIIQFVQYTFKITNCKTGNTIDDPRFRMSGQYIEAWNVRRGRPDVSHGTNSFYDQFYPDFIVLPKSCYCISVVMHGQTAYYPGCVAGRPLWSQFDPRWGNLWGSETVPSDLKRGILWKKLSYESNCCVCTEGRKGYAGLSLFLARICGRSRFEPWSGEPKANCKHSC